jgi:hypothetical protein
LPRIRHHHFISSSSPVHLASVYSKEMTNTSSRACHQAPKGDAMTSIFKTGIVLAGAILLCVGGTAQAGMDAVVKANVPFAFVVGGKTMPAGRYRIERDELSPSMLLIQGDEKGNHAAAFVLSIRDGGHDPAGSKPVLTFNHVENTYQLTGVWDSQDEGFDVVTR